MKILRFRECLNHADLVNFVNEWKIGKEDIQQILPYCNGILTLYYWEETECN